MAVKTLYKYLDVKGGLEMLKHHNLQFTNATCLNDPLDSHPALFDYSIPYVSIWEEDEDLSPSDSISENGKRDMTFLRESTWICSLSKLYDSLLMWSYYNMHKGICIGINMENLRPTLPNMVYPSLLGVLELEVAYDKIIKKRNYFDNHKDYWGYQVSTKAEDWRHEQEIRLTLLNPSPNKIPSSVPMKPNKDEITDLKDAKFYPVIGQDCFESVYLGIWIDEKEKKEVISVARKLNPEIKIYQMTIDTDAFRLKEKQL